MNEKFISLKENTPTQLSEWLNSNKQKTPNIGEDAEQQELNLLTAVGMENGTSTSWASYEAKYRLPPIIQQSHS